jgi:hypothetical protein
MVKLSINMKLDEISIEFAVINKQDVFEQSLTIIVILAFSQNVLLGFIIDDIIVIFLSFIVATQNVKLLLTINFFALMSISLISTFSN